MLTGSGAAGDLYVDVDITAFQPEDVAAFKYAPTTSCDEERSFSQYNAVLKCNRLFFEFKNLREMIIEHCNRF